jgi:hypothetical protein
LLEKYFHGCAAPLQRSPGDDRWFDLTGLTGQGNPGKELKALQFRFRIRNEAIPEALSRCRSQSAETLEGTIMTQNQNPDQNQQNQSNPPGQKPGQPQQGGGQKPGQQQQQDRPGQGGQQGSQSR